MKTYQKFSWLTLAVSLFVAGNAFAAETPSGTVVIDETQVMLLLGGSLGGGTLLVGSESYHFKVSGLKLGGVGVHKVHLTGDVYHLNHINDFAGTYVAAEAALTVVKGRGGFWLRNGKGVVLSIGAHSDGLALGLGVEGLKITMK